MQLCFPSFGDPKLISKLAVWIPSALITVDIQACPQKNSRNPYDCTGAWANTMIWNIPNWFYWHDDMWWYVSPLCSGNMLASQPVQDIGHFMIRDVWHRFSAHQTPNPNYQILCKMQPGGHLITTWQPNMKPLQDTLHSTWLWLSSLIRQGPQRTTPLPDWGQAGRYIQSIPAKHFFVGG